MRPELRISNALKCRAMLASVARCLGVIAPLAAFASNAQAEEVSASAQLSGSSAGASAAGSAPAAEAPKAIHDPLELGFFLGALFPSNKHALRDPFLLDSASGERGVLDDVAPELGLRLAYLPIPYIGIEVEGAVMPTSASLRVAVLDQDGAQVTEQTTDTGSATLFTVRGHLVLQVPTKHITPFILGGVGRHFINSDILGDDADVTYHFGGGVKLPLRRHLLVRLDVRDTIIPSQGPIGGGDPTGHWPEALVGLSYVCGGGEPPPPPPPAPIDSDHDGLTDDVDKCPVAPANTPDGCPIPDTDGDGVVDNVDECPTVVGNMPNGCPDLDPDKDNIPVPTDICPDQPGIAPDGCPDLDLDKDGVPLPTDKCPDQPETKNGYEDADGCPDEVPEVVKKFTGVVKGINFEFGKATIKRDSFPLLDQAAQVLIDYPTLRMEISGHTDNVGKAERNLELSRARADSVRAYMLTKGIDSERLVARGAGAEEPIAENKTKAGQALNRRIEFKILQ